MKADSSFAKLRADPFHPSLHFKRVGRYWSARVDLDYRAVAIRDQDDVIWFWIGTHTEYERLFEITAYGQKHTERLLASPYRSGASSNRLGNYPTHPIGKFPLSASTRFNQFTTAG